MIRFGWVLWHINPCKLFNAKSSLYIYIKYIGFGLVGFYGISTIVGYFMPNPFLYISTVLFQTIRFSINAQFKYQKHFFFSLFSLINKVKCLQVLLGITNNSIKHQLFIYTQLNVKSVLFQSIQFSISTHFSSLVPIDRILLGTTSPDKRGPASDAYKKVLHIRQSSSIIGGAH